MQSNNSLLCFFLTVLFEIIGRFRFHDNKNDNENDNAISFSFSLRFCTQRGSDFKMITRTCKLNDGMQ